MIRSFKHKGLERFFNKGDAKRLPPDHLIKIDMILTALHAAEHVEDVNIVTFRLHKLTGNLKDYWSTTVRANWRIIFQFRDGDAHDVDYLDYH